MVGPTEEEPTPPLVQVQNDVAVRAELTKLLLATTNAHEYALTIVCACNLTSCGFPHKFCLNQR
ncbi:hypothetical protein M378DRAFT_630267 [Amanita muscaria Koide BX008]|uniref:Uncharacterized protein n=1 Tax=Amanita muscaria (strain Koide BX008) TaxID=946122 RepID=A0A0C2SM16_AMAMK|nr:hypothetical protein M378DRAFT_630267 [Amanita muscaria Koide BX008]